MLKEMSGASEPCGMVTEDAAFTLFFCSPRMEEKEGGANNVLEEIMVENVPNLVKDINSLIQVAQQIPR